MSARSLFFGRHGSSAHVAFVCTLYLVCVCLASALRVPFVLCIPCVCVCLCVCLRVLVRAGSEVGCAARGWHVPPPRPTVDREASTRMPSISRCTLAHDRTVAELDKSHNYHRPKHKQTESFLCYDDACLAVDQSKKAIDRLGLGQMPNTFGFAGIWSQMLPQAWLGCGWSEMLAQAWLGCGLVRESDIDGVVDGKLCIRVSPSLLQQ